MTQNTHPENLLICPNCQAVNAPRVVICTSCGVNMQEFRAALPHLESLKATHERRQISRLAAEINRLFRESVKKSNVGFRRSLLLLLAVVLVLLAVSSAVALVYANQVKRDQAQLQAYYETSLECLHNHEYLCARDGFENLIKNGADLADLSRNWNVAQYGLAEQYFNSGQWEKAVQEYDRLLQKDPGNTLALEMLRKSYDLWINQLGLEGKWFKRWMIIRERDARFPQGEE